MEVRAVACTQLLTSDQSLRRVLHELVGALSKRCAAAWHSEAPNRGLLSLLPKSLSPWLC